MFVTLFLFLSLIESTRARAGQRHEIPRHHPVVVGRDFGTKERGLTSQFTATLSQSLRADQKPDPTPTTTAVHLHLP